MAKKYKVERSVINGVVYYSYRGISVSRADWESASCPIYCDEISDKDMEEIPQRLYNILVDAFGTCVVQNYIEKGEEYKDFYEVDDFRSREEENLFLEYGGRYYEDMSDEEFYNLPKETLEESIEDEMNKYIEDETKSILSNVFTETSYMNMVYDIIIDDVKTDVKECADEEFNDSDVSLAVQRALMKALNIEI